MLGPPTSKSSITTKDRVMRIKTHPGEVLKEEFLKPLDMSARQAAAAIDVPANRITEIIRGRRDITADTAIRLGRYFDTSATFWINLQAAHDLSKAEAETDYSAIKRRA
jgi:addiction module HigA family antidote